MEEKSKKNYKNVLTILQKGVKIKLSIRQKGAKRNARKPNTVTKKE
jgi:hypothetical protein